VYLVIDTWVWEKAQRIESGECGELLFKIFNKCEHKILLDTDGEILEEYVRHISDFMAKLFQRMSQIGKMTYRPKVPVNLSGFDPSDMKFIQVALSTPNAIIVSGDSDFLCLRKEIEKGALEELRGLRIVTPEEALTFL